MHSSGYRKFFLPVLIAFLLPALFQGCHIELGHAQSDKEITGQYVQESDVNFVACEKKTDTQRMCGNGLVVNAGLFFS